MLSRREAGEGGLLLTVSVPPAIGSSECAPALCRGFASGEDVGALMIVPSPRKPEWERAFLAKGRLFFRRFSGVPERIHFGEAHFAKLFAAARESRFR